MNKQEKEILQEIKDEINKGIDYANGETTWKGIDKLIKFYKEKGK